MEIILLGFLIRLSLAIIDIHFFPLPGGEFDAFSFNRVATEFSDPADGPVTTTFYPEKSKTDLFTISIGIGF